MDASNSGDVQLEKVLLGGPPQERILIHLKAINLKNLTGYRGALGKQR